MNLTNQLLAGYKNYLSNNLRKILINYDISFCDFIETSQRNSDHENDLINFLNGELQKIKFPITVRSINKCIDSNEMIHISFMANIEKLFDKYEEGYFLPIYSMLTFNLEIDGKLFFDFLCDGEKLNLKYASINGCALLEKVSANKLQRFALDIQNETLLELIRG